MEISLVGILIWLLIIGLALYIIQVAPINATVKQIAYVVVIIFVLIWLLQMLVGFGPVIRIR